MDVRPELQLQSMIKAMNDIVLPAVDIDNRLAQEQAHLVIATLQLVANRLPIAYRYDRDELERYVGLSRDLLAAVGGTVGAAAVAPLQALVDSGADVLARARAEPSELESTVFALRAGVGELIQDTRAGRDPRAQAAVRSLVLSAAKQELERERALVVDIGFEADPLDMPAPILEQLPPLRR